MFYVHHEPSSPVECKLDVCGMKKHINKLKQEVSIAEYNPFRRNQDFLKKVIFKRKIFFGDKKNASPEKFLKHKQDYRDVVAEWVIVSINH